ncbi:lysine/ornithine N-monooxygenase [Flagelloscypha sp. PMI_526]|nr:lysine/ornithine N-monooxygenase [Flagelloscypha sp. PMI_526]
MASTHSSTYDLVGIGFGPANLALACALAERLNNVHKAPFRRILFIEKHENFRWHPGMLLPGTRMQISYMKDLATLRNPQSPYTFIAYLHEHGRLASFINRNTHVPTRKEFADYLAWTSDKVQAHGIIVHFGQVVTAVHDTGDGSIEITSRDIVYGTTTTQIARNIIISPGGSPHIPPMFSSITSSPLALHSSSFVSKIGPALEHLASLKRAVRICVVGSGQSAAETTMNLRERLNSIDPHGGNHEIEVIVRKGSLKPSDDTPFSNQIFDPSSTDRWYATKSEMARETRLAEYQGTNYGVVNPVTLDSLYEIVYDQEVDAGIRRRTNSPHTDPQIILQTNTFIVSADQDPATSTFTLVTQNTLTRALSERHYDLVLFATGYKRTAWIDFFKNSNLGKRYGIHEDSDVKLTNNESDSTSVNGGVGLTGDILSSQSQSISHSSSSESTPPTSPGGSDHFAEYTKAVKVPISRNYRLIPTGGKEASIYPRVYLQGVEEKTHGLSDTLLSVVSVRSGEVLSDLLEE